MSSPWYDPDHRDRLAEDTSTGLMSACRNARAVTARTCALEGVFAPAYAAERLIALHGADHLETVFRLGGERGLYLLALEWARSNVDRDAPA